MKGVIKFSKRVMNLAAATAMHSQLTTALFNFGSSEMSRVGKGKKIRFQPNRKRKSGNGSRQAVAKGRPSHLKQSLQVPPKKPKCSHDLAEAAQSNTQSSKKSGSHVMKSKTKHIQKKTHKVLKLFLRSVNICCFHVRINKYFLFDLIQLNLIYCKSNVN